MVKGWRRMGEGVQRGGSGDGGEGGRGVLQWVYNILHFSPAIVCNYTPHLFPVYTSASIKQLFFWGGKILLFFRDRTCQAMSKWEYLSINHTHIHLTGSKEWVQNKDCTTAPGGIKLVTFNNSPSPATIPPPRFATIRNESLPICRKETVGGKGKVLMNYHHSGKDRVFFSLFLALALLIYVLHHSRSAKGWWWMNSWKGKADRQADGVEGEK